MRLPDWFPEVSRPWNPAYKHVWDAMSSQERKWSFLIDMCIVGLVIIVCIAGYHFAKGN
jgi:hypothetical protein